VKVFEILDSMFQFMALLNCHTALELAGYVLFDVVDETHQDNFTELTIPLTRSDGGSGQRNICTFGTNFSIQPFAKLRRFDKSKNVSVTNCSK